MELVQEEVVFASIAVSETLQTAEMLQKIQALHLLLTFHF